MPLDPGVAALVAATAATAAGAVLSAFAARRSSLELSAGVQYVRRAVEQADRAATLLADGPAPRVYYHLDAETMGALYRQLAPAEDLAATREVEQSRGRKRGLSLSVGPFAPTMSAEKGGLTRHVYEPERDPDRMARAVEKSLLESDSIAAVDLTRNTDDAIDRALEPLRRQGFSPLPAAEEPLRIAWREFQGASRLASLSGFVVVRGEFQVQEAPDRRLHLTASGMGGAAKVQCSIARSDVRRTGEAALQVGTSAFLSCVGKVINWQGNDQRLTVLPLALF